VRNFCDAPMVRLTNGTLHFQPAYWYMGHFSRFLPRNSIRIAHTFNNTNSPLEITTWLVDVSSESVDSGVKESVKERTASTGLQPSGQEVVIIVLNRQNQNYSFEITTGVNVRGAVQARVNVPPHSVHSLHFDAAILNSTALIPIEKVEIPPHRLHKRKDN